MGGVVLGGYADTADLVATNQELADPGVGEDCEVWSFFGASQDGVDVCYGCAAAAAVVGVVCYAEETNTLCQAAGCADLAVEVMDYWDIHGG